MKIALVVALLAGLVTPPAEFGTDWDDPQTAAPAVARPSGPSCTVRIVDNKFVNFDPYQAQFTPPAACPGRWKMVVLKLSGAVAGRQFDRLGRLAVGDVTIFKTSTPEPSVDGIKWTVEKDITAYSALLARPQPVTMWLGNVVNETYTGILDIQVDLTFYPGTTTTPDDVLPLSNGTVTVAPNTERLLAEVYATGSGGGCEEFWYITAPPSTGYSCQADNGPYREVQILIDGQIAGIAAPYPHIYTGGWSNPFLWYAVPAPRAFDLKPIQYDLSPFVGRLTDGTAHTVSVQVAGVPAGQSGWEAPIGFLAWRDHRSSRVTGNLLASHVSAMTNDVQAAPGSVTVKADHAFGAIGYVNTSHGRVTYAVSRVVSNTSAHTWGADENPDSLQAAWTDVSNVVIGGSRPSVVSHAARYSIDGTISIGAGDRLTTAITITDAASHSALEAGRPVHWTLDDTYTGTATFTLGVPRPDRHATGTSRERYQLRGSISYDKTLSTVNGFFT